MSEYSITMTLPDLFREAEIEVTFEFEVTSWGDSGSYWDPPEPPEWEITAIYVEENLIPWVWMKEQFYVPPEQKIANGLWQALADAGTTYIDEHFDWGQASMDAYDDYYED